MNADWQPSTALETLARRARLNGLIRRFFERRSVLEIEAPVMATHTVTDPFIDSVSARCGGRDHYLQSSPEYAMKRLLAAGAGSIYSLGKVFRDGEAGRRHNPEFTLLEWYRPGWDDRQLMDEVAELVNAAQPELSVTHLSYRDWFERHLGLDPHRASAVELAELARARIDIRAGEEDRNFWLDLLVTHELEPTLSGLTFIYDYPASQAALARLASDERGETVARRFEAYLGPMELANGYWELTDAAEQRARFEADRARRRALGKPAPEPDEKLLAALEAGLPPCAGVALGVDRWLMALTGADHIRQVIPFTVDRS